MSYPDFSASPKLSNPEYAWPDFSIVGFTVKGLLWLKSEINKGLLRLTSQSKDNTLRMNSEVDKGLMNLQSKIQLN